MDIYIEMWKGSFVQYKKNPNLTMAKNEKTKQK